MKALRKEFRVEVRKSFSRFISILLIVALGVAFYAGIRATEPDMRKTGDYLYDESHMMDLKIVSTMGLSDSDLEAISKCKQIEKAVGSFTNDVIAKINGNEQVVEFMSETDGINEIQIKEGRKPEKENECVLDSTFMKKEKIKIGDTFTVSSGTTTDIREILTSKKYTVVGSFTSSQYLSNTRSASSIGNGKVAALAVVKREAFSGNVYTEIYATVKGAKEENCYSKAYENKVKEAKDEIDKNVKDVCIKAKYDELYGQATQVIEQIEAQMNAKNQEIKKNQNIVKKNQKQIAQCEQKVKVLDAKIDQIQPSIDNYDHFIEQYGALGYVPAGKLNNYDVKMDQLEREKQKFVDQQTPLKAEKAQTEAKKETCKTEIEKANGVIETDKKQLKELDLQNEDAKDARELIESPAWYITDRTAVSAYVEFDQDAQRINNIGKVFPVIFFLVAALVSLTTMTRMITEQRTQIGTLKALGYSKFPIAWKYIKYAMLATVTGSVIGGIAGAKLFPVIILNAYKLMYPGLGKVQTPMNFEYSLTATSIAIICVLAATIFASYKTLSETPSKLMRPLAPKVGKKILLEYLPFIWKHMNFHAKSSIRNMVRYKKRFFMTLFGISGCTALIVVGFGLKDSTQTMMDEQYGKIHTYDAVVSMNTNINEKRQEQVNEFFSSDKRIKDSMKAYQTTMIFSKDDQKEEGYMIVPEKEDQLKQYIKLQDRETKKEIALTDQGVVIDEKLANLLNVKEGDGIQIGMGDSQDAEKKEVTVEKITENYLYHYVYMSDKYYKQIFGTDTKMNKIFIHTSQGTDETKLTEDLLSMKACQNVTFMDTIYSKMSDVLKSIDIIVAVLIVSAGGLAFVVLYNLNNINIAERKRELATLKVLGFYNREVTGYVVRENVIITIFGILLGCVLGAVLHRFVIQTAEVDAIMFGREIHRNSYLYSALITVVFTVVINFTMKFKIRKINMAESMKSVE